jgi:3'-phosphoadenosine 5'-phosphosulfate sulfotransferase (PAPS reductase)/FAD synthetase
MTRQRKTVHANVETVSRYAKGPSRRLLTERAAEDGKETGFDHHIDKLRTLHPHGSQLVRKVRPLIGDRALLAFSGGKDSVAAALYLQRHFKEVIPLFLSIIPGLSFVDEMLAYYERHLFRRPIRTAPHPAFLRWVSHHLYADPVQAAVVDACCWPRLDMAGVENLFRRSEGLPMDALVATGIRAEDSPVRRLSLQRYGPITLSKRKWHPIWDWSKRETVDYIERAGLRLSREYAWMPRSFASIHASSIFPIKKHAPNDYARILEWMPLIEAQLWRYERAGLVRTQAARDPRG